MTGKQTLAVLFVPESEQWGMRGDPEVWREMRRRLEYRAVPPNLRELIALLHTTFEEIVGIRHDAENAPGSVYLPQFDNGLATGGGVSFEWWQTKLMPLLETRAGQLLSGPPGTARIVLRQGDITRDRADAIVNAANSSLLGGGGVDGAIHRAGGPAILAECKKLRAVHYPNGLPTGQAVATTSGHLSGQWVIHTVGPVWSATEDRSALLASCYRESLRVAGELGAHEIGNPGVRAVAFPAISTGIYGWPIEDGARIAIETVRSTTTSVAEVRFVLFDERAYAAFSAAL